jgi:methyl-accepting chemotaxis protein
MELAYAVKDALTTIQEHATRSSQRAENTAHVIQQTADSSQKISASMNHVTDMVSDIKENLQTQEGDIDMVFEAVENISGMAAQVNRSMVEQKRTAVEIRRSMEEVTEQFSTISDQTGALLQDSDQIVSAMYLVKSTAEQILSDANGISQESVQRLIEQSEILQKIVQSFKIS